VVSAIDGSGNESGRSEEAFVEARARVTGRFVRARSFRAAEGVLRGRRLVFAGRLAATRGAPAALRRGRWTARLDLTFSPEKRRASARGRSPAGHVSCAAPST
jgi:hypothetical protein